MGDIDGADRRRRHLHRHPRHRRHRRSLSAQVAGLELVTGDGDLLHADETRTPTSSTSPGSASAPSGSSPRSPSGSSRCSPSRRTRRRCAGTRRSDRFDELAAENHHFEMYWFPHTDRLLTKRNNRTLDPPEPLPPLARLVRRRVPLQPVFGWVNRLGNRRPGLVPRLNELRRPGADRAPLQRRPAQGVHLAAAGGVPRDGVRRAARGRPAGAARRPGARSSARLADQLPGRGPRRPRPTTSRSRRRPTATRSTSPST